MNGLILIAVTVRCEILIFFILAAVRRRIIIFFILVTVRCDLNVSILLAVTPYIPHIMIINVLRKSH